MHKLMTIPAGRLAQWKGCTTWTHDNPKETLTAANQMKERPKYSEDSNRFPILMIAYAPQSDTTFSQITSKELRELAYTLATCSNPKPITKEEKRILWHKPYKPSETTDLAIPYFDTQIKPQPNRPPAAEADNPNGMHDDDENDDTDKSPNPTLFYADSRPTKARLLAGRTTDISRSIDRMLATRAAALIEALGTNIGSLHTHHRPHRHARQCPSCRVFTTLGVSIPTITTTPQRGQTQPPLSRRLNEVAKDLRQKIFKKIVTEDLSEWTPPNKINWNATVSIPATPQENPSSGHSRTRRPKKQTPTTEEPAPERTKRDHKSLQEAPEQKPRLPQSVLTQLVNVIKSHPINVCLACALPHTSALQRQSDDTTTHPLQDNHLDA